MQVKSLICRAIAMCLLAGLLSSSAAALPDCATDGFDLGFRWHADHNGWFVILVNNSIGEPDERLNISWVENGIIAMSQKGQVRQNNLASLQLSVDGNQIAQFQMKPHWFVSLYRLFDEEGRTLQNGLSGGKDAQLQVTLDSGKTYSFALPVRGLSTVVKSAQIKHQSFIGSLNSNKCKQRDEAG